MFHRISPDEPPCHAPAAKEECPPKKQDDNGIGPHCVRMTNEQVTDTTFAKSGVLVAMFVPVVSIVVAFFQNKISHRHNPKPGPIMTLFKKRNQMLMY